MYPNALGGRGLNLQREILHTSLLWSDTAQLQQQDIVAITNLAKVIGRTAATGHKCYDAVALEKFFKITLHGVDEGLVRRNLQFSVEKRLRDMA